MTWVLIVMTGMHPFFGAVDPIYKYDTQEACERAGQQIIQKFAWDGTLVSPVNFRCVTKKAHLIG